MMRRPSRPSPYWNVPWPDSQPWTPPIGRVLGDNGSAYHSHAKRNSRLELALRPKRAHPYQPRPTARMERFHRARNDGWAHAKFYGDEAAPWDALPPWIHEYDPRPSHTTNGNQPAIGRLTNCAGH